MALFGNPGQQRRSIYLEGKSIAIQLEPEFWQSARQQADRQGVNLSYWVRSALASKPDHMGRASWLRVAILQGAAQASGKCTRV